MGNIYFGGHFATHSDILKHEVQVIRTMCSGCGYETQHVSFGFGRVNVTQELAITIDHTEITGDGYFTLSHDGLSSNVTSASPATSEVLYALNNLDLQYAEVTFKGNGKYWLQYETELCVDSAEPYPHVLVSTQAAAGVSIALTVVGNEHRTMLDDVYFNVSMGTSSIAQIRWDASPGSVQSTLSALFFSS